MVSETVNGFLFQGNASNPDFCPFSDFLSFFHLQFSRELPSLFFLFAVKLRESWRVENHYETSGEKLCVTILFKSMANEQYPAINTNRFGAFVVVFVLG